ncbi:thioesterase family protein [Pleionea sediminis]|uniref:thioesterase family protein n=1 Tax=Pleionea sediminis TaxID=2569479 RepID=UPI001185CE64|nr:thioesterase family protein [Pleionea sediminis]
MNILGIDEILASAKSEAQLTIDKSWSQGRTVFGGLSAALLIQSMMHELPDQRPLRVANFNFIAPLLSQESCQLKVTHLRDGKNVTHLQAQLIQNELVCVQSQACFANDRSSKVNVTNKTPLAFKLPKKPSFLPMIPKVTPNFIQHVSLAIVDGRLPFTGSEQSNISGWMKFKKANKRLTWPHIIALADAWPPTVLQMLRWPKPASTLSWQIEILQPHCHLHPDDWVGYEAITRQASEGYAHCEANIWSPTGELIMLSRQIDAVFA